MLNPSPYESVIRQLDALTDMWQKQLDNSEKVQAYFNPGKNPMNLHYENGIQDAYKNCISNLLSVVSSLEKRPQ